MKFSQWRNFEISSVEKFWNFLNGQILKFSQWTYFEIFSHDKFCSFLNGQILKYSQWTNFEIFSMNKFWNFPNGLILKFSHRTNFAVFSMDKFWYFVKGQISKIPPRYKPFPLFHTRWAWPTAYGSPRRSPIQFCHLPVVHRPPPCDWFCLIFWLGIGQLWKKFGFFRIFPRFFQNFGVKMALSSVYGFGFGFSDFFAIF